MKKLISIAVVLILCFLSAVNVLANDYGIAPCYNNVSNTFTDFSIDSNGKATVYVSFDGYSGVTTGATISAKLEKRFCGGGAMLTMPLGLMKFRGLHFQPLIPFNYLRVVHTVVPMNIKFVVQAVQPIR